MIMDTRWIYVFFIFCIIKHMNCKQYKKKHEKSILEGIFVPVFSPMDKTYEVNVSVIPKYAKYLKSCKVDGVVVADIAGEGPSLNIEEKEILIDGWVNIAKSYNLKVIVQAGGTARKDTYKLIKYCETVGVDGIYILPQPYITGDTVEKWLIYFETLSKITSLPIYFYHYPELSGLNIDIVKLFRELSNKYPIFKGIKAQLDVADNVTAQVDLRHDQTIFIFNQILTAGSTLMGYDSHSLIASNFFHYLVKNIIDYTNAGEFLKAKRAQEKLNKIVLSFTSLGDFISAVKAAMEMITGIEVGPPRPPLLPLSKRALKQLRKILEENDIDIAEK